MNASQIKYIAFVGALAGLLFTITQLLTLQISVQCSGTVPLLMLDCGAAIKGLVLPLVSVGIIAPIASYFLKKSLQQSFPISIISLLIVWQLNKLLFLIPQLVAILALSTFLSAIVFVLNYLLFAKLKAANWVKIGVLLAIFVMCLLLTTVVYLSLIRS